MIKSLYGICMKSLFYAQYTMEIDMIKRNAKSNTGL